MRPAFFGALLELLHRGVVVLGWDAVVEHHAVGDLAGHLHHLRAGRADHDRDVPRLLAPVNDVELDVVHVVELAMEGHALQGQQPAHHLDGLAHRRERLAARDADVARQRIPPGADAADDAVRCQVVEREEGGGEEADVAGPVVDDA